MPPLSACGRRWEFGSDDLVIPGAVVVAVRLCWFLLQLIGVAIFHETLSCQHQQVFAAVAYTSIVVTLCVLITEGAIVLASAQGTVLNSKPRRFVAPLLHCRLVLSLLELLALLIKTGLAAQAENPDDISRCSNLSTAVTLARTVVAITWFIFGCLLVAVLVYLDPCHLYSSKVRVIPPLRSQCSQYGTTLSIDTSALLTAVYVM